MAATRPGGGSAVSAHSCKAAGGIADSDHVRRVDIRPPGEQCDQLLQIGGRGGSGGCVVGIGAAAKVLHDLLPDEPP